MRMIVIAAVTALALVLSGCVAASPEPTPTPAPTTINTPSPSPVSTDSGPRDGATGTIEFNSNGTPVRYTVAEGDYPDAICSRFNLYREQLVFADTGEPVAHEIYPGDVIRFAHVEPDEGDRP